MDSTTKRLEWADGANKAKKEETLSELCVIGILGVYRNAFIVLKNEIFHIIALQSNSELGLYFLLHSGYEKWLSTVTENVERKPNSVQTTNSIKYPKQEDEGVLSWLHV